MRNYAKWEISLLAPHIFDAILAALAEEEEEVQIQGFGRFSIKIQKAHNAINPNTKERIWVPEKKKLVFHPTPSFKFNADAELSDISDFSDNKRSGYDTNSIDSK